MATHIRTYAIPVPGAFQDYPRYFRDTVKEIIALRDYGTLISLHYDTHLVRAPRVVLSSDNENTLWLLSRAIDSEIRTFPFSYVLSVSLRDIEDAEEAEETGLRSTLKRLIPERDYKIFDDFIEEGDEVHALVRFNRASHREYFAEVVSGACRLVGRQDSQDDFQPQRPISSATASKPDGQRVVSLEEVRAKRAALEHHRPRMT